MNAINADYLMEFVKRFEELSDVKKKERNVRLYLDASMLRYAIEKFPVHYEVEIMRHGRWIETRPHLFSVKCSVCNKIWELETPYCPSCGAKMDLKE